MSKLRQIAEHLGGTAEQLIVAYKSQDSILPNQRYVRAGGLNHLSHGDKQQQQQQQQQQSQTNPR